MLKTYFQKYDKANKFTELLGTVFLGALLSQEWGPNKIK